MSGTEQFSGTGSISGSGTFGEDAMFVDLARGPGDVPEEPPLWLVERDEEREALAALDQVVRTDRDFEPAGAHVALVHTSGDLYAIARAPEAVAAAYRQGAASVRVVCVPASRHGETLADWLGGRTLEDLYRHWRQARIEPRPAVAAGGFVSFVSASREVSPIIMHLSPVPAMDPELLPKALRRWLLDIAERASCPLDLPAVSALVCLSAAVGRQLAIRPKKFDDWTVVPNLWGAGVLPPGWLKSYCLEEPKKPLAWLELEARQQHAQELAEFELDQAVAVAQSEAAKVALKDAARIGKKRSGATPEELRQLAAKAIAKPTAMAPTLRRYIVNDATVEKLGELLAENPQGLLLYRDELMGFLLSLEKLGHEGDRAFYLESWNGTGSFSYDRIGRGSLFIPSNTVSILGGIQPGKLFAYIRDAASGDKDDGFISRFQLLVYPDIDQPFQRVDRKPDREAQEHAYALFGKLAILDYTALGAAVDGPRAVPYLRFSPEAQAFFDDWFQNLEIRVRSSRESACLIGHLAKYRSLMPSLALLFHLLEMLDGRASGPLSLAAASRAAAWCDYLESHARRIYQAAFDSDPEPAQRLAERLKGHLPDPFTSRDIQRKGWKSLGTADEIQRALGLLEEHGWVYAEEVPATTQGGRPTTHYHKNPRLLQGGG